MSFKVRFVAGPSGLRWKALKEDRKSRKGRGVAGLHTGVLTRLVKVMAGGRVPRNPFILGNNLFALLKKYGGLGSQSQ